MKGLTYMDKKELKTLITGLTTGERLTVTFLGDYANRTGTYELVGVKTGRGKGGSKIMTLKAEDGSTFDAGTAQSDVLLNVVTADGVMHGFESASDMPKTFETNAGQALELKKQMKVLVGTTGARVRVTATEPSLNGEFTVKEAKLLKGRYGQAELSLVSDAGDELSLWSFRHSVVITGFEILDIPTQDTLETVSADEN